MDVLSRAIARVARRQEESDRRLERIEKALGIAIEPAPRQQEPPQQESPQPAQASTPPPIIEPPTPEPSQPPPPEPPPLETQVGLTWINRIGSITLVLGIAFFFKYAVDNEWIGESGRVLLGV